MDRIAKAIARLRGWQRAALAIAAGDTPEDWHRVIDALVAGLAR